MTRDDQTLSFEEIRSAVRGMERELAKGEGGPYGVRYDYDLATLLATTKLWLSERAESEFCNQCAGPFDGWLAEDYGGHWDTCPNRTRGPKR